MDVFEETLDWNSDSELFQIIKKYLYSAVVGDILDEKKYFHQFLPPTLNPIQPGPILVGRAMTVVEADYKINETNDEKKRAHRAPFGKMLAALDGLKENEIYICSGASFNYALWGELMSARAIQCGCVGAVVMGYHRDTPGIIDQNFPVYSMGRYSQDQAPRGEVVDFRVPLQIGPVLVQPGDIIIGDIDGVVVIPQAIEKEIIRAAYQKAIGEKVVRKAIEAGMSATDAFEKYGIL